MRSARSSRARGSRWRSRSFRQSRGAPQIGDRCRTQCCPGVVVRGAQDRGRVVCRDDARSVRIGEVAIACRGDRDPLAADRRERRRPSVTMTRGFSRASSSSSHAWQATMCRCSGVLWMRRLPRGSKKKCLTALVGNTRSTGMPASSSSARNSRPAGPTNGRPRRSSSSPGCSPTSINRAPGGPSPCAPLRRVLPQLAAAAAVERFLRRTTRAHLRIETTFA